MHVATDGGRIVLIDASMQSTVTREIVLASGPSDAALTDALEHNGILYVAGYFSETVDRLDIASSVWLTPISIGNPSHPWQQLETPSSQVHLRMDCSLSRTARFGPTFLPERTRMRVQNTSLILQRGDCTTTAGCQILFVQEYSAFRADVDSTAVGSATQLTSNTL